jgi:hypothetical protein
MRPGCGRPSRFARAWQVMEPDRGRPGSVPASGTATIRRQAARLSQLRRPGPAGHSHCRYRA